MPNWCENVLEISHEDKQKLREVAEAYNKGELFNYFKPLPNDEWDYGWCVSNWGTKWDINGEGGNIVDVEEFVRDGGGTLNFDTAWGPGLGAMAAAEEAGFSIVNYYHEPGMCFAGIYSNGDDESYEYSGMSPEQIREDLPEELNEMFSIAELIEQYQSEEFESEAEDHPQEEDAAN